jgi:hypothetical protein
VAGEALCWLANTGLTSAQAKAITLSKFFMVDPLA